MSHVLTIQCEIKNLKDLKKALKRCEAQFIDGNKNVIQEPVAHKHRMYNTTEEGIGIRLRGWNYPVVINNGKVAYDNFNGRWGDLAELHKLQQAYAVESTLTKARASGQFVSIKERQKQDGCIELLCVEQ
jgi:hypothetical protein